jgi:hypothetical protein
MSRSAASLTISPQMVSKIYESHRTAFPLGCSGIMAGRWTASRWSPGPGLGALCFAAGAPGSGLCTIDQLNSPPLYWSFFSGVNRVREALCLPGGMTFPIWRINGHNVVVVTPYLPARCAVRHAYIRQVFTFCAHTSRVVRKTCDGHPILGWELARWKCSFVPQYPTAIGSRDSSREIQHHQRYTDTPHSTPFNPTG